MTSVVRYGAASSVEFDLSEDALVAQCGQPSEPPLTDPAGAAAQALAAPLDYPALAACATPSDRVVLTVDRGLPSASEIVAEVVREIVAAGVAPDGIAVLRTRADVEARLGDPRRWLSDEVNRRISLVTHDPADRAALAYLALTHSGEPILLNRAITDADVVLPIGCYRGWPVAGYYGMFSPVYPVFSDQRAQMRFRSPTALDGAGRHKKQVVKAVDDVGWLLGVSFTVQVIPGARGEAQHVLAGAVGAVESKGRERYEAVWRQPVRHRASLVVAAIEGNAAQQSWDNFGRALASSLELVEEGGTIAVCSELAEEPGPAVKQLAESRSRRAILEHIRKDRPEDALPAFQLAQAQERATVYLLSRLDPSIVEELEMAPIGRAEDLVRLARRHESCILLSNAPYAMPVVEE